MSNMDTELDTWRREWQSEQSAVPDLAVNLSVNLSVKVRRHSRFMRAMFAADILVTVLIGGGTTAWAIRSSEPDVIALAAATWLFLAIAWMFATVNRRGCWAPAALNASAFLDISIRRCRRGIAAAKFGMMLYGGELLFCLTWIYRRKAAVSPPAFLTSAPVAAVWICTAVFVLIVLWYQRRKRAELAYFLELQAQSNG